MSTTIDYAELAQNGQEQFLAAVRETQQAIVDSVSAWSQTMQAYTSAVPAVPEPNRLPAGEQLIDDTFDLAEKMVAGQREFARNLLTAVAPARPAATPTTAAKPQGPKQPKPQGPKKSKPQGPKKSKPQGRKK